MTPDHSLLARVGQAIRAERQAARITQEELAERVEVDQSTISGWERATGLVGIDQIAAVEQALGIPAGTVLRRARYLPEIDTVWAIQSDPAISAETRRVLSDVYRASVGRS